MNLVPPIIWLTALVAAIICFGKAIWHAFGMVRGVRPTSEWWVNLVPFLAFAQPDALDSTGQVHRAKFARWGAAAFVFAGIASAVQFAFHP